MTRSLLLIASAFLVLFTACKKDNKSSKADIASLEVDFTINGIDLERYQYEYSEDDYNMDKENPDRTLFVTVDEPVEFADISTGGSGYKRTWLLDDQVFQQEIKTSDEFKAFSYNFEIPGFTKITLFIDDVNQATKWIKVVEGERNNSVADDDDMDEGLASILDDDDDDDDDALVADIEEPVRTAPKKTNTSTTKKKKKAIVEAPVKKAKPEIKTVDFRISKLKVKEGESFQLQDISSPESAITKRIWDFGDGNSAPTNGKFIKHSYSNYGDYTIRLCLNYSDKCTSQKIQVIKKPEEIRPPIVQAPKKEEKKITKPEIKEVKLSIPSTGYVGKPIQILDESQPKDAITSRAWTIDKAPLNSMQRSISKVFEKAGTYTVELCLNKDSKHCVSKSILIKDVDVVKKPESNAEVSSVDDFICQSYGKTGLLSMARCHDAEPKWQSETTEIVIKPKATMEIRSLKAYGNSAGEMTVTLKSSDGKLNESFKNAIIPGPFNIGFSDLGVILEAGKTYTVSVTPEGGAKIENSSHCSPKPKVDSRLGITYKNGVYALFDLKYCY